MVLFQYVGICSNKTYTLMLLLFVFAAIPCGLSKRGVDPDKSGLRGLDSTWQAADS